MSAVMHTPCPWHEYTEMGVHAVYAQAPNRPDRIVVATVDFYNEDANAKLIAAAPDLAKALQNALIVMSNAAALAIADTEEGHAIPPAYAALDDEIRFVRAALAKAGL